MSLHNLQTTLTPDELLAIQNCLDHIGIKLREKQADRQELSSSEAYLLDCYERGRKWAAAQSELLYEEWAKLPPGSHLKEAYAEDIWMHSDRDLHR